MEKMSFADLFRRIQNLTNSKDLSELEEKELDFYSGVLYVFQEVFNPGTVGSLVEIPLFSCPPDLANEFARKLDLHVVKGSSGTVYLSWPDKVPDDY